MGQEATANIVTEFRQLERANGGRRARRKGRQSPSGRMGFARLAVMSALMLVGTLLAALLPMHLSLSARRVHLISVFSTGLLIGAALTVVIPEGIAATYESLEGSGGQEGEEEPEIVPWIGGALLAGFIVMYLIDTVQPHSASPPERHASHRSSSPRRSHSPRLPLLSTTGSGSNTSVDWEEDSPTSASTKMPLSPRGESARLAGDRDSESSSSTVEVDAHRYAPRRSRSRSRSPAPPASAPLPLSTVIGLLAHSVADGVSLGASSLSSSSGVALLSTSTGGHLGRLMKRHGGGDELSMIVFFAIMIHKAPTAFALSSLLLSAPRSFARRSLLLFSAAAPVGAILTYLVLRLFGAGGGSEGSDGGTLQWATGLTLTFSGGTFLFVATHVMQEKQSSHGASSDDAHRRRRGDEEELLDTKPRRGQREEMSRLAPSPEPGRRSSSDDKAPDVGKGLEAALVLGGMVLPGLLSTLVGHGH